MTGTDMPRGRPCASCPYRRDAPSGVWARSEYEALRRFDGTTTDQATAGAFVPLGCHQGDGPLCAGWAGCHDMRESLAVRIGIIAGTISAAIFRYTTTVPLFASGAEAADHGERDIENPSETARSMTAKVVAVRDLRGQPVRFTAPDEEDPS